MPLSPSRLLQLLSPAPSDTPTLSVILPSLRFARQSRGYTPSSYIALLPHPSHHQQYVLIETTLYRQVKGPLPLWCRRLCQLSYCLWGPESEDLPRYRRLLGLLSIRTT